ncbi:MAG: DUF3656 domain-containing protein [Lachnospiraceae bacterium]|nr:DUF3656 domain-containing protein [Lachnospiraceae bacterium]
MIELLAPGGSYDGMKAAVNAGADAIYMGGRRFGARAYAKNPEETELLAAMDYCHLHGRRLYLTVNTLLKETELERELYDYILPLYEHGVDAILVQDFGVFCFLRRNFPDLELHASTQMTITGPDGARLLKRMGAKRIVTSRELSLKEISEIHRQVDIEIEAFVHGALCYCYSGQCLMSSLIGGRSGNRGRCAQPCRLPYDLIQDGSVPNRDKYLLSLKDICTLELLADMAQAGICSLKIEGRMKRAEYAAGVTAVYRKYLDQYVIPGKKDYRVEEEDLQILMDLYNRGGFSKGYYQVYNGKEMMSMKRPNHYGTEAVKVLSADSNQIRLKALEPLWEKDTIELTGKETELMIRETVPQGKEFTVSGHYPVQKKGRILSRVKSEHLLNELQKKYLDIDIFEKIKGKFMLVPENPAILSVSCANQEVTVYGEIPEQAQSRPLDSDTVSRQLQKTGGTLFQFEQLDITIEGQLFYPMQSLNAMRRSALEELKNKLLEAFRRKQTIQPVSLKDLPLRKTAEESQAQPELRVSVETWEQLEAAAESDLVSAVYVDCCMFFPIKGRDAGSFAKAASLLHARNKKCCIAMPVIWRPKSILAFEKNLLNQIASADGFLLRNAEELEYLQTYRGSFEWIADSSLYTYNREAREFLREQGITGDTIPLELNLGELKERGCEGSEITIYGYQPLMITAQCLIRNTSECRKTPGISYLKDRKEIRFPVKNQCSICTNIIYNSLPLNLFSFSGQILGLHPASVRLAFTLETKQETAAILEAANSFFAKETMENRWKAEGTRGHFKRGVE